MSNEKLCPFSKPLIGNWCQCIYATLSERCSGKMVCAGEEELRDSCVNLVDLLKEKSRFVLGISSDDAELTHTQLMKIRCGGLLGIQRVLNHSTVELPVIREIMAGVEEAYGSMEKFPFNEIVRDIKAFSHRKKKRAKEE